MKSKILFYNVENLFDTLDDPLTNDNAYLPGSPLKWVQKRYVLKLQKIARVLKEVEDPMPGIIGLAEVENRKVLGDLIVAMGLTEKEAGIVHADSPDERGMDVGLLYRKDLFTVKESDPPKALEVLFEEDSSDRTRDILRVCLFSKAGDKLYVYVNHWPSRREGTKISQSKRFAAAKTLHDDLTHLMKLEPDAQVIVMGDFNCTPDSPPIYKVLDQKAHPDNPLINLGWDIHLRKEGSTNYRGKWLLFDQILVTPNLLGKNSAQKYSTSELQIVARSGMLFYNPKYHDYRPDKTYGGNKYHGGFSDHLPVMIELADR